jgi:hypothetical protein
MKSSWCSHYNSQVHLYIANEKVGFIANTSDGHGSTAVNKTQLHALLDLDH